MFLLTFVTIDKSKSPSGSSKREKLAEEIKVRDKNTEYIASSNNKAQPSGVCTKAGGSLFLKYVCSGQRLSEYMVNKGI